jgi:hypothetical protein
VEPEIEVADLALDVLSAAAFEVDVSPTGLVEEEVETEAFEMEEDAGLVDEAGLIDEEDGLIDDDEGFGARAAEEALMADDEGLVDEDEGLIEEEAALEVEDEGAVMYDVTVRISHASDTGAAVVNAGSKVKRAKVKVVVKIMLMVW